MPQALENTPDLWRDAFPHPGRDDNKYTRGAALIYGGAVMTGAARLAARAAQRMGAGLVTLAAAQSAVPIYAEALESVIIRAADTIQAWRELLGDPRRHAVLIGPGLGIGALQAELVLAVLETRKTCVLDADALTNFSARPDDLLSKLHDRCILTPHEGEFARFFGAKIDEERNPPPLAGGVGGGGKRQSQTSGMLDAPPPNLPREGGGTFLSPALTTKLNRAVVAAKLCGCTVLLKGAETIIAAPDGQAIINRNAPPTLATGGSGDVLAGMILGLVVQNMPVFQAGAVAAWLHGAIAADFGPGLIAEDIVDGIPAALKDLFPA